MTNDMDLSEYLPETGRIEGLFDRLWPICRSITGEGFRRSLDILREIIPLEKVSVASGTQVFDWEVPPEWNVTEAYVEDPAGKRVIDFQDNNLHLVGYSEPVDQVLDLVELQKHLYSLPDQPGAIPYITSYYKRRWGFCMTETSRRELRSGQYRVVVRSSLEPGHLTYGHLVLPATEASCGEFLISTDLCHPSLANNELSGPIVTAFLYEALKKLPRRRFDYRFVVIPETIGAIAYLARWGEHLKENCVGGLVATCIGDDRSYTYKKSRQGKADIDRCAINVLQEYRKRGDKPVLVVDFFALGSDERQYCSPGFDLPVGSLMRTMYAKFPEYHTSLDNKDLVSAASLRHGVELYLKTVISFEENRRYLTKIRFGEPCLGKRGLYPSLSQRGDIASLIARQNFLINFSDGEHDLCAIAQKADCSILDLARLVPPLIEGGVLEECESSRKVDE